MWCPGQLARTSTNLMGPEVNDYVSLQWPSYEQPQGSNLRPQREQTFWFQVFIIGLSCRWFEYYFFKKKEEEEDSFVTVKRGNQD